MTNLCCQNNNTMKALLYKRFDLTPFQLLILMIVSCTSNQAPVCNIISPESGSIFALDSMVNIEVEATDEDGVISKVDLYVDDVFVSSKTAEPYYFTWTAPSDSAESYTMKAVAFDDEGLEANDEITLLLNENTYKPTDTTLGANIYLSIQSIYIFNQPANLVGNFIAFVNKVYEDFSYSLTSSKFYPDNNYFSIIENQLFWKEEILADNRKEFQIEIEAKDEQGNTQSKVFTIKHEAVYLCMYAMKTVVADGYFDEVDDPWHINNWLPFTKENEQVNASNAFISAKIQMLFDDKFLYLGIEVKDKTKGSALLPEDRDHVELYLSMDTTALENGRYGDGCWLIGFQRNEDENLPKGRFHGFYGNQANDLSALINHPEFKWEILDNGHAYTIEMKLPKAALLNAAVEPADFIRFDVGVFDNSETSITGIKYLFSGSGEQAFNTMAISIVEIKVPEHADF